MSALPVIAPVARAAYVEVEYYDEKGAKKHWNLKESLIESKMMNRVLQHEIDHMDGIICVDLVKNPRELLLESDPKFYDKARFEVVK